MKKILTIFTVLLISAIILGQSPDKISYQAVMRDVSGDLIIDLPVGMQISILQGSESGAPVYTETQTPTTNENGLVSLEIGTGTTVDDFSAIDWSDGPYFIKTEVDPEGGSTYSITGTSQLLSVPYAMHARTADNVDELEARLDSLILALSPPFADFSADNTTIIVNESVQFTDESTNNPESWSWDFGDGSPVSTEQNPSHIYSSLGAFTVTLTASNEYGDNIEEKVDFITINPLPPVAAFSSDKTRLIVNGTVSFTDESTKSPTGWSWDFGDGSPTSTDQNPSHTYTNVGTYTVTLTASNMSGSDDEVKTDLITVYPEGQLTDYDGNIYNTVTIGTQTWMAENLKVTHYSNGDAIPLVTGNANWAALEDNDTNKAYCWYGDDKATYEHYGALYTYAAAVNGDNSANDVQGACPVGWHIPSFGEWQTLINFLGGMGGSTGSKLSANEALWTDGLLDSNADFGTSGFNALPAWERNHADGSFAPEGDRALFWNSNSTHADYANKVELDYSYAGVYRHNVHKKSSALSIRCIKDSDK